jgi:p-hydroxybenzoate 3-monooxygenase
MRTQVGIVGAGPAGLLLSQLLAAQGIESVLVESRSREYCEARVRAGVLEDGIVDLLVRSGVGGRLQRQGLQHGGIYLQWPGERHHIDFQALCGHSVWVYGQTEVVKDLISARLEEGQQLAFEVSDTRIHDIESERPSISYIDVDAHEQRIECDYVAGCDGFHGVSRALLPTTVQQTWERTYPYGWLGILAEVQPSTDELIYAWHPRGFAMHSMRSPFISRLYLQVDPDADLNDWPDERIWDELSTRLAFDGWQLDRGPVLDKGITPMRSFVSTPMRHGRLLLAGDAAHIVPPTGAKGLNLALADVALLAEALTEFYSSSHTQLLDAYSDTAVRRVWRKTHFSWWMTSMLHTHGDAFDEQLQLSQLRYTCASTAAAQSLAENYTGAVG